MILFAKFIKILESIASNNASANETDKSGYSIEMNLLLIISAKLFKNVCLSVFEIDWIISVDLSFNITN